MSLPDELKRKVKNVRVAAIQMISTPRVEENLQTAGALIAEAFAFGAELVALPAGFRVLARSEVAHVDGAGLLTTDTTVWLGAEQ